MTQFRRWLTGLTLFVISIIITTDISQANVSGNGGLNRKLNGLLYQISRHFNAPVTVVSGCRSYAHNRRIGGARESWHLRCMAADIRVQGVGPATVFRYAGSLPGRGGVGSYCRDSFIHIDVGDRREWHWGCHGERRFSSVKGSYTHVGHWRFHQRLKYVKHHHRHRLHNHKRNHHSHKRHRRHRNH
jgi:Peptidase M15